jgi:hypothetical protein
MANQDFSTSFLVDQGPEEAFEAVTNVRGWWSENITGGTAKLNDEFNYQVPGLHTCTMRLTEVVPNQKVVWDVLDNYFSFTKDQSEWVGNKMVFEITPEGKQTKVTFTQQGLVPAYECYDICNNAWCGYINGSLHKLITTGKGQPNDMDFRG